MLEYEITRILKNSFSISEVIRWIGFSRVPFQKLDAAAGQVFIDSQHVYVLTNV
jgi:hypothetical protein